MSRDGGAGHEGLLEQPHTSAGRVPTARAFRLYVDRLSGGVGARLLGGAQRLNLESQRLHLESQIDSSFAGVTGTQAGSAVLAGPADLSAA